jgi:uncharacterized protein involved in exopolysaccharide biosynthesis
MSTKTTDIRQDDEIDLRELILTLWRGKWIILAVIILCGAGAFFYATSLPDQYAVTTKAATAGRGGPQLTGLAALAGNDLNQGGREIDLLQHVDLVIKNSYFMDHLLSREWVIQRLRTEEEREAGATPVYDTLTLQGYWEYGPPDTTVHNWKYRRKMSLYGRLRSKKREHIAINKSGGVLELKTTFTNPSLAYQINLELVELLKEYFKKDYQSRDRQKRQFIEERLSEVKQDLQTAEARLANFLEQNIVTQSPRIILREERLKREVDLAASLYKELNNQLEMAKIDEKKEVPVFEVLQEGELPLGPSEPNRKLLLVIGIVLGVAVGIFLVFLLEWIKSFRKES